jgi:hypothetical protein
MYALIIHQHSLLQYPTQEYGSGNLSKKHSTFFASMMRELGLSEQPEEYLDAVPWQVVRRSR